MDSWDWNKIIGAVLGTLLFVLVDPVRDRMSCSKSTPRRARRAMSSKVSHGQRSTGGGRCAGPKKRCPISARCFPPPTPTAGEVVAQRCEQCHDSSKGGPDKIGPNLWGVVGRAARDRSRLLLFERDDARITMPWTFDKLFNYLKSPADDGAGHEDELRRPAQRAGSHQPDRLSAHASRQPAADSGACAGCASGPGETRQVRRA